MKLDADVHAALDEAFENMPAAQTEEFQRRFKRLCENALISNQADSEVRRVLELIVAEPTEDS